MKKFMTGWFAAACLCTFAGEAIMEADFNAPGDFTLKNQGRAVKSFTSVKGLVQVPGKTGTAMLSATQNLADFPEAKGAPQKSLRFTGLKGFPLQEGALELWIKPYFNEETKPGKVPHNYFLRCFGYRKTSRVLTLFIVNHKTLNCQFELEGGKKAYLYYSVKNWQPKQWMRINVVWNMDEKKVYVNGVLAASKKVSGPLQMIDSLELGAIDSYLPFQGMIDEFKVTAEPPADLKEPPAEKKK